MLIPWSKYLEVSLGYLSQDYLPAFPPFLCPQQQWPMINAHLLLKQRQAIILINSCYFLVITAVTINT